MSALVSDFRQYARKRGGIAAKPVGDHGMWQGSRTVDEIAEEALGSNPLPLCLDKNVDDYSVVVHGSP